MRSKNAFFNLILSGVWPSNSSLAVDNPIQAWPSILLKDYFFLVIQFLLHLLILHHFFSRLLVHLNEKNLKYKDNDQTFFCEKRLK